MDNQLSNASGLRRLLQLHAQITNLAQAEPSELRYLGGHLLEDVLDHVDAVASADSQDQIAENLPIVARTLRNFDRPVKTLQATPHVDHGAPFLRPSRGWQQRRGG